MGFNYAFCIETHFCFFLCPHTYCLIDHRLEYSKCSSLRNAIYLRTFVAHAFIRAYDVDTSVPVMAKVSRNAALGCAAFNCWILEPNPLPACVQNWATFLPERSTLSRKLLTAGGSCDHQMGWPRKIMSYFEISGIAPKSSGLTPRDISLSATLVVSR